MNSMERACHDHHDDGIHASVRHRELFSRPNSNMRPAVELAPWNARIMEIVDPLAITCSSTNRFERRVRRIDRQQCPKFEKLPARTAPSDLFRQALLRRPYPGLAPGHDGAPGRRERPRHLLAELFDDGRIKLDIDLGATHRAIVDGQGSGEAFRGIGSQLESFFGFGGS